MQITIQDLQWDSTFFGFKIAKIELKEFTNEKFRTLVSTLKQRDYKLVYLYVLDRDSNQTLLSNKLERINSKVTLQKEIHSIVFEDHNIISFSLLDQHYHYIKLEKLALLSGQYSRFKLDNKFVNDEFKKLYKTWIRKSVEKEIANDVLVYMNSNIISGMLSYKIEANKNIIIGLVAVDQDYQKMGIGKTLLNALENIANKNKINKIVVDTQLENEQAVSFYKKCGYSIIEIKPIYHLWI